MCYQSYQSDDIFKKVKRTYKRGAPNQLILLDKAEGERSLYSHAVKFLYTGTSGCWLRV